MSILTDKKPTDIFSRIGHLARMMRNGMASMGLEQSIMDAAEAIPDARERLNYVVRKTSQAAEKVLSCVEETRPLQESLSSQATELNQRWNKWFDAPIELPQARELVTDTRQFLSDTPNLTRQTNDQLMEIMMAQDFQDLTGQVIQRMMSLIEVVEKELIQVLVENIPVESKTKTQTLDSLKNGPQLDQTQAGVVGTQEQVDDLLESLGF